MPSLRTLLRGPRTAPAADGQPSTAAAALLEMSSALVFGLEAVDGELDLAGHAERVAALADQLAANNGVSAELRAVLRQAALLHEVGMIGVPAELLRKAEPLTAEERIRVHAQAELGAALARVTCGELAATLIRHQYDDEATLRGKLGEDSDAYVLTLILRAADVADEASRARPGDGDRGFVLRDSRPTLRMDPATAEAYAAAMAA